MTRINPLSRRPKQRRLVVAVRGAAGTGKSVFAASLADAGMGRLCLFDTERKARLLPGADGATFDAFEIEQPDELPEFVDWALGPEGQQQGYGCYALDSWAMYFGRKHRATVEAVRARTGDPLAKPSADDLRNDQILLQEVLRRLCVDSGACVVITDQIAARGDEEREENEMGRVLPMTTSGLEYFVDVMLEMELRLEGFETVRVARVVKSNAPSLPVGMEFADPTFLTLLDLMGEGPRPAEIPVEEALAVEEAPPAPVGPTVDDLLAVADRFGVDANTLAVAARHYCGTGTLARLSTGQIADLMERMEARYAADRAPSGDGAAGREAPTMVAAARKGRRPA
ncbi:MAG TPA: hypothetical protein VK610_03795 [Rhodothermales bacterium]|nr:hypothetical protein [Rhodothermales bacterium]